MQVLTNDMTGQASCGHLVRQGEQYLVIGKRGRSLCADCGRRAMAERLRKELEDVSRLLGEG